MKSLHKTIIFSAFALFFAFGTTLNAQNCACTTNGPLKGYLGDIIVKASQAQGNAQQIATFASNGNTNQLANKISQLGDDMTEIAAIGQQIASVPYSDRSLLMEISALSSGFNADISTFNLILSSNNTEIVVLANTLRDSLNLHKGQASDLRVGICCRD